MRAAICIIALITALTVSASRAQDDDAAAYLGRFTQFEDALHATRQSTARWPIVFSRIDAFGEHWTIITFGYDRAHAHEWRARRLEGGGNGPQHASVADSLSCPTMRAQLAAMEDLRAPRIDVPGIGTDQLPTVTDLDGDDNRLWTQFGVYDFAQRTDGALELDGNVDTPLARWADAMMAALEACWRPSTN